MKTCGDTTHVGHVKRNKFYAQEVSSPGATLSERGVQSFVLLRPKAAAMSHRAPLSLCVVRSLKEEAVL
ncbi:hypothetical protein ZHAS_00020585 [Anopheles sinensis]|uniref:Uncharacterized protein n=1 Tax=Anopheles sinensis TaxID=74873 RepID=A0A084WQ79_ANOSI|nr:hypothetical protein ZHAS_00020585 [Anopheles sinensis]